MLNKLKLIFLLFLATVLSAGCVNGKKISSTTSSMFPDITAIKTITEPEVPDVTKETSLQKEDPKEEMIRAEIFPLKWKVVKGNSLWKIAGEKEVYNYPEKWALIYKENIDQIQDADLIYPGQILNIPRHSSKLELDAAINHAKTRGDWDLGPIEVSDQNYLKKFSLDLDQAAQEVNLD